MFQRAPEMQTVDVERLSGERKCGTLSLRLGKQLQRSTMVYLALKALLSGIIIAIVSEVAKRSPGLGALIASLPLVSVLAMIWLWRDTSDVARIASHAEATFWLVLPTLPMFLILPWLLRGGTGFWIAMGVSCLLTVVLYLITIWALPRLGIEI